MVYNLHTYHIMVYKETFWHVDDLVKFRQREKAKTPSQCYYSAKISPDDVAKLQIPVYVVKLAASSLRDGARWS